MATVTSVTVSGTSRVYTNSDGTSCTYSGGTLAWRNNNPGNVVWGDIAKNNGAIGKDGNNFAIFPTYAKGLEALHAVVTQTYGSSTINSMMAGYAPSFENNTAAYQAFLSKKVGVTGDTAVSKLTPAQLSALESGIVTFEGTRAGKTEGTDCNTTKTSFANPVSSSSSLDNPSQNDLTVAYQNDPQTGAFQIKFLDGAIRSSVVSLDAAGNTIDSVYDSTGSNLIQIVSQSSNPFDAYTVNGNNFTSNINSNVSAIFSGSGITVNGSKDAHIYIGGNGASSSDSALNIVREQGSVVNISDNSRVNVLTSAVHTQDGGVVYAGINDNIGAYGNISVHGKDSSTNIWVGGNGKGTEIANVDSMNLGIITVVDNSHVGIDTTSSKVGAYKIYTRSDDVVNIFGNKESGSVYSNGDRDYITDSNWNQVISNYGKNSLFKFYGEALTFYNYGNNSAVNDFSRIGHIYNYGSNDTAWVYDSSSTVYNSNSTDTTSSSTIGDEYYGIFWGMGGDDKKIIQNIYTKSPLLAIKASNGDLANLAEKSLDVLKDVINYNITNSLTGARWDKKDISWSIGELNGNHEFSNSDISMIKKAFSDWEQYSGLHFHEIKDSSKADIQINFTNLDSINTSVLGYTEYQTDSSKHLLSGTKIFFESPLETTRDADGIYAAENVTFYQLALHEIGHAIGLGSSADKNSIESIFLGSENRNISEKDIETVQGLYGINSDSMRKEPTINGNIDLSANSVELVGNQVNHHIL